MDRPIDVSVTPSQEKSAYKSGHLMCRSTAWGVMGFLACAYFAWISLGHILRSEYDWPHDNWNAATYVVWIVLLIGLMLDTHCLRERLFFATLVVNFVVGFSMTLWRTMSPEQVHSARIGTGALWAVAGVLSLATMGRSKIVGAERER